MSTGRNAVIFIIVMMVLLSAAGCGKHLALSNERPVATVGANKIYDVSLDREVIKSMQVVRNKMRNEFYGFSPLRMLKLLRGNLAYLLQETALVLPAGSLDRNEVLEEADNRASEKAKEVYDLLKKGESWDKLNEEYSQFEGKADGGKLPLFPRGYPNMPEDFYNSKPGDISQPFQWSFGYSILRLDSVTKGSDGKEQFGASMILIVPDEKAVTAEMIGNILNKKQVEIIDPVIRGYQMYDSKEYDRAIQYLASKSPAPGWPDLGYYVSSLCAQAKGDTEGRIKYLRSAVEHSRELSGLRSYYQIELGDILLANGDLSAGDYFRKAFDESANDYDIVKMSLARFEKMGDDEYANKAKERLVELDNMIQRRSGGSISNDEVVTGEVHAPKPDFGDL